MWLGGCVVAVAALWLGTRPPTPSAERPRTRHLLPDGTPKFTNRLARQASPYLRQHANNPVDWYPWGDEAFAKARDEMKPILLSIGYSTCHWCHVMEEESFDDETVAAVLNTRYVAIKVDREERPDVDAVYMNAVQIMIHGGGGWHLTVWLTPERKPYYGATYLPPRAGERGMPTGFLDLLTGLADAYAREPARVDEAAADVAQRLAALATSTPGSMPTAAALTAAFEQLRDIFDETHGGFGQAPKFPRPSELFFLFRHHRRSGDPAARRMAERTLDAIANGGVHDHLAGGFHRYATDAAWRTPHYEKMLYDNALITLAFLEGAQVTGRADFADVAGRALGYLEREMLDAGGGFHAASDADSEGEEGTYFVWTAAQVEAVLGAEPARLVNAYYDLGPTAAPLATPKPLAAVAEAMGMTPDAAARALAVARPRLLAARRQRPAPHVDRKVITSWNGLAIQTFARAALVLRDPHLTDPAAAAARAILRARRPGHLPRYLLEGEAHGDGYLNDYAFFIAGLLDLYEVTGDPDWFAEATTLQRELDGRFADANGGYFLTGQDHEILLTREKPDYDGAEPTGNSVALANLLRLHELTGDDWMRRRAESLLMAFGTTLAAQPSAAPYMLCGLAFHLGRPREVVLVSPGPATQLEAMRDILARTFTPDVVVATVLDRRPTAEHARLVPLVADKTTQGGKTTAYVCEQRTCKLPTTDPAELERQLAAR